MARWQLITVIIAIYLVVTLGIGLRAGRKASKSVT
jgi:Na+/proline symporter